jgi:N-acetyl-beta-hexosaminidase
VERQLSERGRTRAELQERGHLRAGAHQQAAQIRAFGAAGVQRIMVQWLDLDDIAGLEQFAAEVLPAVAG